MSSGAHFNLPYVVAFEEDWVTIAHNVCVCVCVILFQAPLWAYLLCAVGLFIYQSLDAIDGKQARRTNSSSPLGELFDHGCDSLSTGQFFPDFIPQWVFSPLNIACVHVFVPAVFVVLGTSIAVQMGTNPDWMFFCCFAGMFMFYCAHWQTYVSGTLRFGMWVPRSCLTWLFYERDHFHQSH